MMKTAMKKKILSVASTIALLLCLGLFTQSCVTNNGDIGRLYGIWNVTAMEVDGVPYSGWEEGEYPMSFFQFQHNICYVTRTNERYDVENRACTWEWVLSEKIIELNFTHRETAEVGWQYAAPEWLLLNENIVYRFEVEWVNDEKMVWTTENTSGQHLTYHLKKNY